MKQAAWKTGLIVCVFALSLIFACAKPPTQEIADAEKAIADAKTKEADLYVQDAFARAQDEMKKANEMVAVKKYTGGQNSRSGGRKNGSAGSIARRPEQAENERGTRSNAPGYSEDDG
jgi:hypothetical protein